MVVPLQFLHMDDFVGTTEAGGGSEGEAREASGKAAGEEDAREAREEKAAPSRLTAVQHKRQ
jgi:hypothetical protein